MQITFSKLWQCPAIPQPQCETPLQLVNRGPSFSGDWDVTQRLAKKCEYTIIDHVSSSVFITTSPYKFRGSPLLLTLIKPRRRNLEAVP